MCGIAGVIAFGPEQASETMVGAMCDAMFLRGPDGGGVAAHNDATIGMRRLAIVDLQRGNQPMHSDDGQIVLVYNGEVYNAPALRKALQAKGVKFNSHSDTEVILRLYEHSPDSVEEHLMGMWAFAIHDRRRQRLVLSRDRFGIKPLFIARGERTIAFASDLKCFSPLEKDQRFSRTFRIDPEAAQAMLCWGYVPNESTIFSGVERLAPSSRVVIDLQTLKERTYQYYSITPSAEAAQINSLGEACDLVESNLRRVIREHLESDVPVACFLSGGIDSSLVTAFANDASNTPIKAFSIGFVEPRFDESPFARQTASVLGIAHNVSILDENKAKEALADALFAYDEPFGDSSGLATYLLSRVVGKEYKVALGGDGGDEVFAGYKKHRIIPVREMLNSIPPLRLALSKLMAALPKRTDRSNAVVDSLRIAERISRGINGSNAQAYASLTQFATFAKVADLVETPTPGERFLTPIETAFSLAHGDQLQKTLASDLRGPLPNDMLTKVDRASMACSLEARVPFLDHRIVEMGLGLPRNYTLGRKGKDVLRALHKRRFGSALSNRKKQGFGVPVEKWLNTWLSPICHELFSENRLHEHGILNAKELSNGRWKTWAKHDGMVLWNVFALCYWLECKKGRSSELKVLINSALARSV